MRPMSVLVRYAILALLVVVPTYLQVRTPQTVLATHKASFCKWDFPWPRTIWYWVNTGAGQFSTDLANRVQYGGNTWTEAGYNLKLERTLNRDNATNYSELYKGTLDSTYIALTRVSPSSNCNRDTGNPITRVEVIWNLSKRFYSDCLGSGSYCQNNGYYDTHDVAAHEFGHWFVIYDETSGADASDTMYQFMNYGDTFRRSLAQHDRDTAWVMYGCRSGYVCR